ncbi:MAG: IS66-like element accessory protein TnpA [Telluria sp.]
MDTIIQPVILPSKRGPYSRHSDEFKRAVVAQSRRGGTSVARVAREHNVNANQVFSWRKQFSDIEPGAVAEVCAFVPVALAAPPAAAERSADHAGPSGLIELTVGKARLRLEGAVDTAALALVLARLLP